MIETPIGETLYYDYYCYVKEHSVTEWNSQTMILYGENDNLCEYEYIKKFASHFNCDLKSWKWGTLFSSKESTRVLSKLVRRES